jgi:nitric oxide reductase activation protein
MPGTHSGSQTGGQTQQSPSQTAGEPETPLDARMEQDQAKMRNLERHKKLVDDTAKLVSLADELKSDVDKSNKDTLSLDVIRKADEIEKLAHSVKEKMKGS